MINRIQDADVQQEKTVLDLRRLICEFFGTFVITLVGSWAIIYRDVGLVTLNGVALAHAMAILVMTWMCFDISGAHFNPAITLGVMAVKRSEWSVSLFYILSQFAGGVAAGLFIYGQITAPLFTAISGKSILGIPAPLFPDFEVSGMWAEVLGGFFFAFTYMALAIDLQRQKSRSLVAPGLALVYFLIFVTVGELSGGTLNPARALGPALVAGKIEKNQFIHFFGSIIGAFLATNLYAFLYIDEDDLLAEEEEREHTKKHVEEAFENEEEEIR